MNEISIKLCEDNVGSFEKVKAVDFTDERCNKVSDFIYDEIQGKIKESREGADISANFEVILGYFTVSRSDINFSNEDWLIQKQEALKGEFSSEFVSGVSDIILGDVGKEFVKSLSYIPYNFLSCFPSTQVGFFTITDVLVKDDDILFKFGFGVDLNMRKKTPDEEGLI